MINIEYGNLRSESTDYDVQTIADFTITGEQSGAVYKGQFTAGSAVSFGDSEQVARMIGSAVAYDARFLEEIEDQTVRGIVEYAVEEFEMPVRKAFDNAEQLLLLKNWLGLLTEREREMLNAMEED